MATIDPMTAMTESYNYGLVGLSVVIAVAASYVALDLAGRVTSPGRRARYLWLIGGDAAMGSGIWSMHYVGMLAFELQLVTVFEEMTHPEDRAAHGEKWPACEAENAITGTWTSVMCRVPYRCGFCKGGLPTSIHRFEFSGEIIADHQKLRDTQPLILTGALPLRFLQGWGCPPQSTVLNFQEKLLRTTRITRYPTCSP